MNAPFVIVDQAALSGLGGRDDRAARADAAAAMALPSTETEQWRYSPIAQAPLARLTPVVAPASDPSAPEVTFEAAAASVDIVDGFPASISIGEAWVSKGLSVAFDPARSVDFSGQEQSDPTVFNEMHLAFSPGAVVLTIPSGLVVDGPIVVRTHHRGPEAISFPHLVVEAGESSEATVIELVSSSPGESASVPVVELLAGPASNLRFVTVQETGIDHWLFGRQFSHVESQATLSATTAAFGGRYARLRTDSHLVGRGSTSNMAAAYYGDQSQVHDFRVFQHHEARDTRSDLLFKGAQDDQSGSIYTGLIHIDEGASGSNAFQTNRNLKLSDDSWAWSVPNLEIENNEVHCSHASTVSPVDGDQQFYLQSRGVPPTVADRLIVGGFYREAIERMPAAVRDHVRGLVQAKLDRRTANAGEAR